MFVFFPSYSVSLTFFYSHTFFLFFFVFFLSLLAVAFNGWFSLAMAAYFVSSDVFNLIINIIKKQTSVNLHFYLGLALCGLDI